MTDPNQPLSRREARDAAVPQRPTVPVSSGTYRGDGFGGDAPDGTPGGGDNSRRRFWLIAGAIAVAFLLLATGAVFAGIAAGRTSTPQAAPSGTATTAPPRSVPGDAAAAIDLQTCSVSKKASATTLSTLWGSVVDVKTGDVLWQKSGDDPQRTASVMKVLTASAAISTLGPTYRLETTVVDGVIPGSITLVGHGDATLSQLPDGQDSVYPGAPKLSDLAKQTITAYTAAHPDVPLTQVILDSSYWDPSDNWDASWSRSQLTQGYMSEVTALQVDGDRSNPKAQVSKRSGDPVTAAGNAFVKALDAAGAPGVTVSVGHAETGAPQLAIVKSAPVQTLVKQMLASGDNTLAEMLARVVSVKLGQAGTGASLQTALTTSLGKFGVDLGDPVFIDGSGLSAGDVVASTSMAKFMAAVGGQKNGLNYVFAALPVSGKTGSLASRFMGANSSAIGKIYGSAGTIPTASVLSGYATSPDGTKIAFSFSVVNDTVSTLAPAALDTLATAVYKCGSNLSAS